MWAWDGTTTITMIEGVVDASNSFGSLQVHAGEAAFVEPGKAPVKRIVVRPRDAVSWSLYYPRVIGGADAKRLQAMGAAGDDLARAADLLHSGQVAQALPLIEAVRSRHPGNALALALAAVIDVAEDRKESARELARRAVEADNQSAAAALALSFVHQADFDIAAARKLAERAVRLDPENADAQARVAELRMAQGDTRGAREAAEKAVRRDPNSARAMSVLGFVQLAELRSKDALATFEKAVAIDPSFPLARLGYGIARFRGNVAAGREEMQTAVLLDPDNSLLRSYLAKAYFEENRPESASKELAAAKQLDPFRSDAVSLRCDPEADLQSPRRGARGVAPIDRAQRPTSGLSLEDVARRGSRGALGRSRGDLQRPRLRSTRDGHGASECRPRPIELFLAPVSGRHLSEYRRFLAGVPQ